MIQELSVYSRFVDPVELSLEAVEIRFAQRPSLCEVHLLEFVTKFAQLVVCVLEPLIDLALPVETSADVLATLQNL